MSVAQICGSVRKQGIVVEVHDWFCVSENGYMGDAVITYDSLDKAFRHSQPLIVPIQKRQTLRYVSGSGPAVKLGKNADRKRADDAASKDSRSVTAESLNSADSASRQGAGRSC